MNQGRFSHPPLAPEDDWFYDPDEAPARRRVAPSEPSARHAEPVGPREPEGPANRRILLAAAAAALVLVIGGVAAALAFTGSDGDDEAAPPTTTPTTAPVTTPTTAPTTTPIPTTPTATTPTPPEATLPEGVVLRPGDESEDVSRLQTALSELGYSTGGVDGKFGPATEQAVREFQGSSGLEEDGVVGPATLAALSDALDRQ